MADFELGFVWSTSETELTVTSAINLLAKLASFYHKDTITVEDVKTEWVKLGLLNFSVDRKIVRKEFAVILDFFIQPFLLKQVDFKGNFIALPTEVINKNKSMRINYSSGKILVDNSEVSKLELFNEKGQLLARSLGNSIACKKSNSLYILNVYIDNLLATSKKIIIQ